MVSSCCRSRGQASKSRGVFSVYAGIAFLLMGYLSNALAGFLQSSAMNLFYWWVTAFAVLISMVATRQRFFSYNENLIAVFQTCCLVAVLTLVPVAWFPMLSQSVLWHVFSGYVVLLGFHRLLSILIYSTQAVFWRIDDLRDVFASVVAHRKSVWWPLSVVTALCFNGAHVNSPKHAVKTIDLAGSLTLAMGVSWGYSFLVLMLASWSGTPVGSLYFCDCWKTMGVVMLGDQMRERITLFRAHLPSQFDAADDVLRHVIPVVVGAGYVAAVAWYMMLPQLGWLLPLRIFATVLVSACPCVISLAEPAVFAMIEMWCYVMPHFSSQKDSMQSAWGACVQSNFLIVRLYYLVSLALSTGGSYLLFGFWMTPWTAGLCMLAGQVSLLVNSAVRAFFIMMQSRWSVVSTQVNEGVKADMLGGWSLGSICKNVGLGLAPHLTSWQSVDNSGSLGVEPVTKN